MSNDVKWIKITTDMFDNRKIKAIRRLPEGNNIILIWVMLLSLAGRCNASGMIFLTENIPYTNKMLADELRFDESVICIALDTLERFGMITRDENMLISVNNWSEYQNVEGMDKIREQTRKRVSEYRRRKKEMMIEQKEEESISSEIKSSDSSKHCFSSSKSNVCNLQSILKMYPDEYKSILEDKMLLDAVIEWMDYKDQKKPKRSNHYDSERGMRTFLNKVVKELNEHRTEDLLKVINDSIANNYLGVTWDKIGSFTSSPQKAQRNVFDEWRNA